ncbi:hypothetical protein QWY14_03115 [Planococcus sp. N028]|uniref:Uncharacterized protein n=1 Tax=Planococcus shixiaomingii TaxID=3058393 RepID=A0ABT8MYU4_9BACL|nr:hypothetical protein [Planococcus sp. N028]MDN7240760.1 hypothetical protein [Planococcus sp. N028]
MNSYAPVIKVKRLHFRSCRRSDQQKKERKTGGLIKVVDTASLELVAEKIGYLLDVEVESAADGFQFRKKRFVKNLESTFCLVGVSPLTESFEENGMAINKASVFLLPEEMPLFMLALIQHPIPFPSNFSQRQTRTHGMYCIRLESLEVPENFAERLSDALKQIH